MKSKPDGCAVHSHPAYGWLRFYSGSLLLPIIAHGVGNNVFYLGGML